MVDTFFFGICEIFPTALMHTFLSHLCMIDSEEVDITNCLMRMMSYNRKLGSKIAERLAAAAAITSAPVECFDTIRAIILCRLRKIESNISGGRLC